jgi:hypothetical protein
MLTHRKLTHTKLPRRNLTCRRQLRQPRGTDLPSVAHRSRATRASVGRAGLLAALVLGAACHSFRPAPAPLHGGGTRVRLRFAEPRDLRAGGAGDTLAWPRVTALVGRVTDVRGDTLHLQAESIRSAGGRSERWD